MSRPARDDEHARRHWWVSNLDAQGGSREDVIRNAAQALALRDRHIADLERRLQDLTPTRRSP